MSADSPTPEETEYFRKIEAEQKARLRTQLEQVAAEEEARKLREAHWMRCTKCGNEMITVNFRGVAIERCVSCNGVYLDEGELEKLAGDDESGLIGSLTALFGGGKGS